MHRQNRVGRGAETERISATRLQRGERRDFVYADGTEDVISLSQTPGFHKHYETLTESQRQFVNLLLDWFRRGRKRFFFAIVHGGPGCGKTYTVVETLRRLKHLRVLKMAPTARLANRIRGKTVHSALTLDYVKGSVLHGVQRRLRDEDDVGRCLSKSDCLQKAFRYRYSKKNPPPDLVVLDELSMTPFWFVYQIARYFSDLGLKTLKRNVAMICMGDSFQLKPVESKLNVFDFPFENYFETVRVELRESQRFVVQYKHVVNNLRELMAAAERRTATEECANEDVAAKRPEDLVGEENFAAERASEHFVRDPKFYRKDPFFAYVRSVFPVKACITKTLLSQAALVLAYKNGTVDDCNSYYIEEKLKSKPLYELHALVAGTSCEVNTAEKPTRLRKGCDVVVTENGCGENAFNGTSLSFSDYDSERDEAVCESRECGGGGQVVRVGRSKYTGKIPLVPGFATTVHKYQGETIDEKNIVMCFDRSADKNLIYTALSRVRKIDQILAVVL